MAFLCFTIALVTSAGLPVTNAEFYRCKAKQLKDDNKCVFGPTELAPAEWRAPLGFRKHRALCEKDTYCMVVDRHQRELNVSFTPWTNGDKLVSSASVITADKQNYALAFRIVAPLRDKMMFHAHQLYNVEDWQLYTKAFTDCKIKIKDEVDRGKAMAGTDTIYAKLKNPNKIDIHLDILQYLQEGAHDLVCLMTTLCDDRCIAVRATHGLKRGDISTCWEAAYKDIYEQAAPTAIPDKVTTECHTSRDMSHVDEF